MINKITSFIEEKKKQKMMKRRREFFKIVGIIIFILVMIKIVKNLKWYNLLTGVVSIESGKKDIAKIEHKDLIYMTKKDEEDQLIILEMTRINWKFVGKYGNGYIFSKDGEELFVKKSKFLNLYDVYTIDNKEYFYEKTSALI